MNTLLIILAIATAILILIVGFLLVFLFEIKETIEDHEEFIDRLQDSELNRIKNPFNGMFKH